MASWTARTVEGPCFQRIPRSSSSASVGTGSRCGRGSGCGSSGHRCGPPPGSTTKLVRGSSYLEDSTSDGPRRALGGRALGCLRCGPAERFVEASRSEEPAEAVDPPILRPLEVLELQVALPIGLVELARAAPRPSTAAGRREARARSSRSDAVGAGVGAGAFGELDLAVRAPSRRRSRRSGGSGSSRRCGRR